MPSRSKETVLAPEAHLPIQPIITMCVIISKAPKASAMTGESLKFERQRKNWTQQQAARHLRVSQGYLSLLEQGRRPVTRRMLKRLLGAYDVSPTSLPLNPPESWTELNTDGFAQCLGSLGYPGFSYFKVRQVRNPAEVLLLALVQPDLDSRVVEALPWLPFQYADMDWEWLVRNAKLQDAQNRLGFALTLARQFAENKNDAAKTETLKQQEALLDRSRLAREDTLCHDSLTQAEKRWLRENRPPEAKHWNLLTDLTVERLALVE
jgi:transcriptional regulator with XRE-family HTH domain